MTLTGVLDGTVALPVPAPLDFLKTLGFPLGAVPIGLALGYTLYRAITFLRNRGRGTTAGQPLTSVQPREEVRVEVTTGTETRTVMLSRPAHAPSQSPPKTNRFTFSLLIVFTSVAATLLAFYGMLFSHYNVLVAWVGKAIFWPTPWVASHRAAGGLGVYDYIFPMYLALIVTWIVVFSLTPGARRLPPGRRSLAVGILALYLAFELVIDSLFFTVWGDPIRNLGLIVRALTGGVFLTLVIYTTFAVPAPLPEVRTRFVRDRQARWVFFGLGILAIALGGIGLYVAGDYLGFRGLVPAFTVLLLLPSVAMPLWVVLARPFYFRARRGRPVPPLGDYHPSVSILIPAFNEEENIQEAIEAADRASANYPGPVSIVIGNDGSTDRTSAVAREAIRHLQHASGMVIDLPHGGKSDALNGALQFATGEIIVRCDADTRISETTGFAPAVGYFADPEVGGVQAQIRPRQNEGWTRKMRAMEIAWQHLFVRPAAMGARAAEVLDGAFSLFRRKDVEELGGWLPWNGEDTELSIRLQRSGYRVCLAFEAIGYEDVPPNYRAIRKQRIRWTRGGIYANARHYPALFSAAPEFGGFAVLFYYLLVLHAGARSLVYVYLGLLTVILGIPGLLHAFYLLLVLLALRAVPLTYYLVRMRRFDVLPWVPAWPFLGIVKSVFRFEGFGSARYGNANEFV